MGFNRKIALRNYYVNLITRPHKKESFIWWVLKGLSFIYGIIVELRNFLYDKNILLEKVIFNKVIIGIGNISWGGTGKTPLAILLFQELEKKNVKVAVITKGYAQDEFLLLKETIHSVFDVKDRENFLKKNKDFDVYILDDSFQYRKIKKNVEILLINNFQRENHLIPAGYLREPFKNIRRADLILVTHYLGNQEDKREWIEKVKKFNQEAKIFFSFYKIKKFTSLDKKSIPKNYFLTRNIGALSGIGFPQGFMKIIEDEGIKIKEKVILTDHEYVDRERLENIESIFNRVGVEDILITHKDFYHIDFSEKRLNYFIVEVEMAIDNKEEFLKYVYDKIDKNSFK